MAYLGEICALLVAVLWTISSLSSEYASKRYGSLLLNIVRMTLTILFIGVALWATIGSPSPRFATPEVWMWLALSSVAGYVIGDYYFLKCFILIGARWGELFMTVAPVAAAFTGWILLGEQMSMMALLGMFITTGGIMMSVLSRKEDAGRKKVAVKLPVRGIVYGLIAGIGQGVGLVFSKQGMLLYHDSITASAVSAPGAMDFMMPFAATMIRCIVALIGFVAMFAIARAMKTDTHTLRDVFADRRAFGLATLSTLTGPCIGVALSLLATMFTSTGITQTIMSLVPVLILWPSHIFFHTKITAMEVVGAIISVCGVALFFL